MKVFAVASIPSIVALEDIGKPSGKGTNNYCTDDHHP